MAADWGRQMSLQEPGEAAKHVAQFGRTLAQGLLSDQDRALFWSHIASAAIMDASLLLRMNVSDVAARVLASVTEGPTGQMAKQHPDQ